MKQYNKANYMFKLLITTLLCLCFLNVFSSNQNKKENTEYKQKIKSKNGQQFIELFQQNKNYEKLFFEKVKNTLKNSDKKKLELEIGGGVGTFNYKMDTEADSLLKWRDSRSAFSNAKLTYEINSKNKVYLSGQYYTFSGGEMTDDDFNNSNSSFAAYSNTKTMRGSGYELELGLSTLVIESKTNQFWLLYGISNRDYTMKPKGIMQVVINGTTKTATYYNNS
jgi:hypothetical protein